MTETALSADQEQLAEHCAAYVAREYPGLVAEEIQAYGSWYRESFYVGADWSRLPSHPDVFPTWARSYFKSPETWLSLGV